MTEQTILEKLAADVASSEGVNGELRGYALITFHDGFYNMVCTALEEDAEAIGVIEDIAECLGYGEEGEALQ